MNKEINVFKLVTGEYVIAQSIQVANEDETNHHILYDPRKIVFHQIEDSLKVILLPWIYPVITDDKSFQIFNHDIITTMKPTTPLLKYYLEDIKIDVNLEEINVDTANNESYTSRDLSPNRVLN